MSSESGGAGDPRDTGAEGERPLSGGSGQPPMNAVEKAKLFRSCGCTTMIVALVLIVLGVWAWSALFGDDRQDAYYACVDVIGRDVDAGAIRFEDASEATYEGTDGNWVIRGQYDLLGPISFTCSATRVSDGQYRISWYPE